MQKLLLLIAILLIPLFGNAQKEISYTLDDRDRLMRVEGKLNSLENQMNIKFESQKSEMNTKFESIEIRFTFLYWALSLLIGLVVINLGYTVWDRRTAIYPIKERIKDLEKDNDATNKKLVEIDKIKNALKEMGESDQKIAEILKRVAIF